MTEINVTDVSEFSTAFLNELKAGGADVTALVNYLKQGFVCDFSTYPVLLASPEARTAAANLVEKAAPSTYAHRLETRSYLNADALAVNRASTFYQGPVSTSAHAYASALLQFPTIEGEAADIYSDRNVSEFTVRNAGTYRLAFAGQIAGFPTGPDAVQVPPSVTSHRFTADPSATGMAVDVIVKILNGTTARYLTLATIMVYPSDFANNRVRSIGGDLTLRLSATTILSFYLQRRSNQGNYLNLSSSATFKESLGFLKTPQTLPGTAVPARDASNYFELMRLT